MFGIKESFTFFALVAGLVLAATSLGNASDPNYCNLRNISSQVEKTLDSIDKDLNDLSFDELLNLTKTFASMYFNSHGCGVPSFYKAFENFSRVEVSKSIQQSVESGMMESIGELNFLFNDSNVITNAQLLDVSERVFTHAQDALSVSYRYAPVQIFVCNILLVLRMLGTKIDGADAKAAKSLLQESVDICSLGLNSKEHEFLETAHSADYESQYKFWINGETMTVSFSYEDTFNYFFYCDNNCWDSCDATDMLHSYVEDPAKMAFENVFSPMYCKMRATHSLYDTTANIEAAQCEDAPIYLIREFISGVWDYKDGTSGRVTAQYREVGRTADTIEIAGANDALTLDITNGQITRGSTVVCKHFIPLSRCEVGVPALKGPCHQ